MIGHAVKGIVSRKDYRDVPPRVEYSSTPFGLSLTQALRPLSDWGSFAREQDRGNEDPG
jgi:DNA-binding HxlR family transcriptional regulator